MLTAGNESLEVSAIECGADLFCLKKHAYKSLLSQIELLLS
jgi:hypothetical protein